MKVKKVERYETTDRCCNVMCRLIDDGVFNVSRPMEPSGTCSFPKYHLEFEPMPGFVIVVVACPSCGKDVVMES